MGIAKFCMRELPAHIAAVLVAIAPSQVLAQSSQEGTDGAMVLEEVTVTARLREERLSDVPDAISAFGADQIEQLRILDMEDVVHRIPNFTMKNSNFRAGVNLVQIRGVSSGGQGFPPVNYIVDGVKSGALQSLNQAVLLDVERIEVLRGPQSATYGAGAIAGAINITTRQPSDSFEGRLVTSYGKGDDGTLKGFVSGPLVENLVAGRLVGYYRSTNGLFDTQNGEDLDFLDQVFLKGRLLFTLGDDATLDLRGSYSDLDAGAARTQRLASSDLFNVYDSELAPIRRGIIGTDNLELVDLSGKFDTELSFATFTATASYVEITEDVFGTASWTEPPALGEPPATALLGLIHGANAMPGQAVDRYQNTNDPVTVHTGDIRLTSSLPGRVRWVAGAEYIERKSGRDLALGSFIAPEPVSMMPLIRQSNREQLDLFGLYAQSSADLTDRLELTIAGRFDWTDTVTRRRDPANGEIVPQPDENGNDVLALRRSDEKFQPKIQLSYRWSDDLMTYFTFAQGYRPGFFASGGEAKPESTKNFEFGFKSTLANRRLSLNGAVFNIDYSDQQQSQFVSVAPFRIVTNVPSTDITGLELELSYLASEKLQIWGSIGRLDAEIDGLNRAPDMAPDWTVNLGAHFIQPISSELDLVMGADWRYQGEYTLFTSPNAYDIDDAQLVDARLSLQTEKWAITGYVQNLLDERYASLAQQVSDFFLRESNDPRSYGVEISYQF